MVFTEADTEYKSKFRTTIVDFEEASLDDLYKEIVIKNQSNYKIQPQEIKNNIVRLLRIAFAEKASLVVTTTELRSWLSLYGLELVFSAFVKMCGVEKEKRIPNYLRGILQSMWEETKPRPMTWQKPLPPDKNSKIPPASDECVKRNEPTNFAARMNVCRLCGYPIRANNVTRICANCQRHGKKNVSQTDRIPKSKRITVGRKKAFALFSKGQTPHDIPRTKNITKATLKRYYREWQGLNPS